MTRSCPSCGAQAETGRFCAECGVDLTSADSCASCGAALPENARFCNLCGAAAERTTLATEPGPAPASPRERSGGSSNRTEMVPWIVAGVAVGILLAVLFLPRTGGDRTDPQVAAAPGDFGDASAVDISSMTPRERADRLFNRVMQSVSAGDSAQARAFLPMALDAYDQVPDLDLDGRYHDAVLHLVDGDPLSARAQADSILQAEPSHLFGHFTAAQAEEALGDSAAARRHYEMFLESYDAEVQRALPEYRDHATVLPVNRDEARRAVAAR